MYKFCRRAINFLVIFTFLILIVWSFYNLIILSFNHWIEPTLFGDSFRLVEQGKTSSLLNWIFRQHNEHRIIFSKLNTLLEVNILNLSPGQSGLFQNLLLVFLSSGIWTYINQKFFKDKNLKIITTLSGITLLLHPWQWENFLWEFQVPWFFINVLVLLGTLLLIRPYENHSKSISFIDICFLIIPWFAIFSTGQGIALASALCISSFIKNKNLGLKVTISSALALFTSFTFLNYVKPINHPVYNFDFKFFVGMLFGGSWHGLFVIVLITLITFIVAKPKIPIKVLASITFPTLFSLFFTMMTTLSRSSFGLNAAAASRYTTHTLMIGLTCILLLGYIAEKKNNSLYSPFIGLSTLLITLGSFPNIIGSISKSPIYRGFSFERVWTYMYDHRQKTKYEFLCMADSALFKKKKIDLPCNFSPHYKDLGPAYFSNALQVKPKGWHKLHSTSDSIKDKNKIMIRYTLQEKLLLPSRGFKIRGFASANSESRGKERFFVIAYYGSSEKQKIINFSDVKMSKENHNSLINQSESSIPKSLKTDLEVLTYIASHPDLINVFGTDIVSARSHYKDYGSKEGRRITFDVVQYLSNYEDLAVFFSAKNGFRTTESILKGALRHYIDYGNREGRTDSDFSTFDAIVPLEFEKIPLTEISIETRNSSKTILKLL